MKLWRWFNAWTDRHAVLVFVLTVAYCVIGMEMIGSLHKDGAVSETHVHVAGIAFLIAIILTGIGLMAKHQQPKDRNEDQDQENP